VDEHEPTPKLTEDQELKELLEVGEFLLALLWYPGSLVEGHPDAGATPAEE
jgi:hypothetical protein